MLQCMEGPAHGENGKGVIFASMVFEPGRILEHGEPPFLQYSFHRAPNVFRADGIDQRLRVRASENGALLADNLTLDDPVTAAFIQVKLFFVDSRARSTARVVTADIS